MTNCPYKSGRLEDQIHLQFLVHIHSELLKLLYVLDHYQTMIIDRLSVMHFCSKKSAEDLKASCATLFTIQLLQVNQHLPDGLHIFMLLLKIIGYGC